MAARPASGHLRFIILTQYYPPEVGAAQVRLAAIGNELTRRGHTVEVVTALPSYPTDRIYPGYRGRLFCTEHRDRIRVRRTWQFAATGRGWKRLLGYLSFTFTATVGLAATRRPDVLFIESPPPTLVLPAWLMSRVWGATIVLNISDLWPDSAVDLGLAKPGILLRVAAWLEMWAYRNASYVTAVTDGIRRTLLNRKGLSPDRVLSLPNGVDTDLFRPSRRDERLATKLGVHGCAVVMLAGSLGYGAGIDVLLHAADILRERPIKFLIVGGGSEADRLRALADELVLPNVTFMDPVPPRVIAQLYTVADIGVMTLRNSPLFEGTRPARIYPAMAAGKPIVYSGAGEGARLVDNAQAGLIVAPEDATGLARALQRLVEDPDLARQLGDNGRRWVERDLTWEHVIGDWLDDLVDRMNAPRGRGRT